MVRPFFPVLLALGVLMLVTSSALAQFDLELEPKEEKSEEFSLSSVFEPDVAPIAESVEDVAGIPKDRIFDDARVFDESSRADLANLLARAQSEYGYEIYVAAYTYIAGETVEERAVRLRNKWVRTRYGIVIVYERGSQKMTMCSRETLYDYLTRPELAKIFEAAYTAATIHEKPAERLHNATEALLLHLVDALKPLEEERAFLSGGMVRLLASFFGAVVVCGALGWGLLRLQQRSDRKRATRLRFPNVVVGKRLGASFGGGVMAELAFDRKGPEHRNTIPPKASAPRTATPAPRTTERPVAV